MMLKINNFELSDGTLRYYGKNHYYISEVKYGYNLKVVSLECEGEEDRIEENNYTCGGLDTAMETIEALENGEEI